MENQSNIAERNKAVIRQLYLECLNQGKWELLEEILDENYEGPLPGKGPLAFEKGVKTIFDAFPDLQFTIHDLFGENNKVVARWQWKAVNERSFRGFPASGKEVVNNGIAIFEFGGDKVVRSWLQNERLELLQQIGVVRL